MREMRNSILLLIATLIVTVGFNSCTDETIGTSISDIKSYGGYGCRPAEKGPDSVNYSMKW